MVGQKIPCDWEYVTPKEFPRHQLSIGRPIAFTNGGTQRMITTKQYDLLNRLTNINSSSSGSFTSSGAYGYNSANQRTSRKDADNSSWVCTYDSLGQVISGKRYWSEYTPVAGQQFEYAFDDIGNRQSTRAGGDQFGSYLRSANYANNALNQITSRDVPGYVNVVGSAATNATVSIWASGDYWAQTSRHGEYYRGELAVNNSGISQWLRVTNLAVLPNGTNADITTNVAGTFFLPQTPQAFSYDADGNLTNDGTWTLTWDAENRSKKFTAFGAVAGTTFGLASTYDYLGRRIQKDSFHTSTLPMTNWANTYKIVYDGWNPIAVLDADNNLLSSFMWGTDLSGTMQGAGGVGGLLAITDYLDKDPATYFYAYDGNGNVVTLVSAADGSVAAQYEYGPFGELIRASGAEASANPFRFSTKFQDDETGFLYYGYRYYNPSTGRWLSRDPIGESGGRNLYVITENDPANQIDKLGRMKWRDVVAIKDLLEATFSKDTCCCSSATNSTRSEPAGFCRWRYGDGSSGA